MAAIFRFRTLGGALIEGPAGPLTGAATQRRRLAVLSLLAANGGGISRDRLVAYLWPESNDEHARHALAQLLYALRQEFGGDAITGSATALRLDPEIIASDIREFDEALARGAHEKVAGLYAGAFLDGFYLKGCDEFERWVDDERRRTLHATLASVEQLARNAAAADDMAGMLRWWRRLAALSPFDSRIALNLIQAMAAAGDPAGAIRQAAVHERLVANELGLRPDPAIASFVAGLETGTADAPVPVQRPPVAVAANDNAEDGVEPVQPRTDVPDVPVPARSRRRMAPSRRSLATAAALVCVLVTLAAIRWARVDASAQPQWIIIADVENSTGDPVFDRTVPIAIAASVGQSARINVVTPERIRDVLAMMRRTPESSGIDEPTAREIGIREGARAVVVPAIAGTDGAYEISARIVDTESGRVLSLTYTHVSRRDRVLEALDEVGRKLRRRLGEPPFPIAGRSTRLPAVATSSIEALEKYADGSVAFSRDRITEAEALWQAAVAIDTAFATAHAALGMLYYWINRPSAGDSSFERALARSAALPERDQVLIHAQAEGWQGRRDAAVHRLRVYLVQHPNDYFVWGRLGYEYLRLDRRDEAAEAFRRLIAIDTLDHHALINLATIEKRNGQVAEALDHYRRAFHIAPDAEVSNGNLNLEYGGTYVRAGDLEAAGAVFEKMLVGDRANRARGLRSVAFLAMHQGHYTEATRHLSEAVLLTRVMQAGVSEVRNRLLLAGALEHLGRSAEAAVQRDSAFSLCARIDAETTLLFWMGKALARAGDVDRTALLLRKLEERVHDGSSTDRAAAEALRGELLVAHGRAGEALAHLEIAVRADSTAVTLESLAHATLAAGALESAASLYETLSSGFAFGWEGQDPWRTAPYWLGRIQEQRSDVILAERAYTQFLENWRDAEPGIVTAVDARNRLARLRSATQSR